MNAPTLLLGLLFFSGVLYGMEQVATANHFDHCNDIAQLTSPINNSVGTSLTPKLELDVPQLDDPRCIIEEIKIQVATSGNFDNIVWATSNLRNGQISPLTDRTIPAGKLQALTKYYWRVRLLGYFDSIAPAIDVEVDSDWSNYRNFTTGLAPIVVVPQCNWPTVTIKTPIDGSSVNSLRPSFEIELSNFVLPSCPVEDTEWVLYDSLQNLQADLKLSRNYTGNSRTWQVPANILSDNKTYYLKVRLFGENNSSSPQTEAVRFTVALVNILVQPQCNWPTIVHDSPPNQAIDVDLTPQLVVKHGLGVIPAPICSHDLSQWQISTDVNFIDGVVDSGAKPFVLLSLTVPDQRPLRGNTRYYWRVRFLSNDGAESDWSTATSFTTVGDANGNLPEPPLNNAQDLCDFDTNRNGLLDDIEFFVAIDGWIANQIENLLFFAAVDAWIGQLNVCAQALAQHSSTRIQVTLPQSRTALFTAQLDAVESMSVEIFDLMGARVFAGQCSCGQLRWNMLDTNKLPIANGVYLYRVKIRAQDGQIILNPVRIWLVMR